MSHPPTGKIDSVNKNIDGAFNNAIEHGAMCVNEKSCLHTQINFTMRLPECYQLNNERIVTAHRLDVSFILQLHNCFIFDDLIEKKEQQ